MQFHFEIGKNGLGMQKKKNQQELVNFFQKDDPPNSNENRVDFQENTH